MGVKRKSSIRFKLILVMVVITILPLIITGILQFRNAANVVFELTSNDLQYITKLKMEQLQAYTQSETPNNEESQKIEQTINDVADQYYKPNGMIGYAFIID